MKKIRLVAKAIKKLCFPPAPTLTEERLQQLTHSCESYIAEKGIQTRLKILWPTPFNQDQTWWGHDGVLINALRLRGAVVIPTMCNKLQSKECAIHGGFWQQSYGLTREQLCNQCIDYDKRLWELLNLKPIRLSAYLTEDVKADLWGQVSEIIQGDWESYTYDGYPIGQEAWKVVVNNNLQGEIKSSWKEQAKSIASHHIFNILALMQAYKKILMDTRPDRIFGNGGFYYQWGALNHLCQQQKIPYYRYYAIGLQPKSWNYSLNTTDILDLAPAWNSWLQQPWSASQESRVIDDLKLRGLLVEKTPDFQVKIEEIERHLKLDKNKPTLLALAGIIWDAGTNVKSDAFVNMYDWIIKTIEWFSVHSEFQLIIRAHPAEDVGPTVAPNERTRLEQELLQLGINIPNNVFLIKSAEKIETYDVMHLGDVGVTYTSTSGLEFACLGKPMIAIGPAHYTKKGFTHEPVSAEHYFDLLNQLLTQAKEFSQKTNNQLALRYWYLYAFHASVVTGLFEDSQQNDRLLIKRGMGASLTHPKSLTANDLLPGVNPWLDYLCDSVIDHLPIIGNNRWPPLILSELCKN